MSCLTLSLSRFELVQTLNSSDYSNGVPILSFSPVTFAQRQRRVTCVYFLHASRCNSCVAPDLCALLIVLQILIASRRSTCGVGGRSGGVGDGGWALRFSGGGGRGLRRAVGPSAAPLAWSPSVLGRAAGGPGGRWCGARPLPAGRAGLSRCRPPPSGRRAARRGRRVLIPERHMAPARRASIRCHVCSPPQAPRNLRVASKATTSCHKRSVNVQHVQLKIKHGKLKFRRPLHAPRYTCQNRNENT